jgi:hypothetical protein
MSLGDPNFRTYMRNRRRADRLLQIVSPLVAVMLRLKVKLRLLSLLEIESISCVYVEMLVNTHMTARCHNPKDQIGQRKQGLGRNFVMPSDNTVRDT